LILPSTFKPATSWIHTHRTQALILRFMSRIIPHQFFHGPVNVLVHVSDEMFVFNHFINRWKAYVACTPDISMLQVCHEGLCSLTWSASFVLSLFINFSMMSRGWFWSSHHHRWPCMDHSPTIVQEWMNILVHLLARWRGESS
jgi:hypothetical protein